MQRVTRSGWSSTFRNAFEECIQICVGLIIFFLFCYFLSYAGNFRPPREPWEWIFITSIIFSWSVQHSLNIHLQREAMYSSISTDWLLSNLLYSFPLINGVLVLVAVIASTKPELFAVHMGAMIAYLGYFLLLDLLVCRSRPSGDEESVIDKALAFKTLCVHFLLGSDAAAMFGLIILWAVLGLVWGEDGVVSTRLLVKGSDPTSLESHRLVHIVMSGAIGLHIFVTGLVYVGERAGLRSHMLKSIGEKA